MKQLAIGNLLAAITQMTLVTWAIFVAGSFLIVSIFELTSGNLFSLLIYVLFLAIMAVHIRIRKRYPGRFLRKSDTMLTPREKIEDLDAVRFFQLVFF
jgi:hypothetical protein